MTQVLSRWLPSALVLLLVAGVVVGVACSGGDDDGDKGPSGQGTAEPADPTPEASAAGPAIAALAAIDATDSAGFHDLAKEIAEATEVNPRWADKVTRVITAVEGVEWDASLKSDADAFTASAQELVAALEAEDLAAAGPAAEKVHETQHDLSKNTYAWLEGVDPVDPSDSDAATASLVAAIDVIDSSGFHDLAKEIAEATEVNPRWAGKVRNALIAANLAGWPADLGAPAGQMKDDLEGLLAALEAEDVAAAAPLAEALHESQHDASQATYAWLAEHHAAMSHDDATLAYACTLKAVDIVDSVGFHDMASDLAQTTEINPRYVDKVANALVAVDFSADGLDMGGLTEKMQALHDALEAGDLEAARTLAEEVHDAQHDFSETMYGHMVSMHAGR